MESRNGREVLKLSGHTCRGHVAAFAHPDHLPESDSARDPVQLWNPEAGNKKPHTLQGRNNIGPLFAFHQIAGFLATDSPSVRALALSPKRLLFSTSLRDMNVGLWHKSEGEKSSEAQRIYRHKHYYDTQGDFGLLQSQRFPSCLNQLHAMEQLGYGA
jgi:hypothetical protein